MPRERAYFLDRMLSGVSFAGALREEGLSVQVIEDYDGERSSDAQWLTTVGTNGWIALTRDEDIRRSPMTLEAVRLSRARMFCLTAQKLKTDDLVRLTIRMHPVLQEIAARYEGPFIATVARTGHVRFIRGGTPYVVFTACEAQQAKAHQSFE